MTRAHSSTALNTISGLLDGSFNPESGEQLKMDPNTLRREIMRRVGEHEATGSSAYVEDKDLATAIGVPLVDVQRQIRILESNGFLNVAATFGPTYAVRLTSQGELALEEASGPGPTPRNPVGF